MSARRLRGRPGRPRALGRRAVPAGDDQRTRLRVSGPEDLLAVVPYLLGFQPRESVVAVLVARRRVVLTARVDLPPPEAAAALAAEMVVLLERQGADELVLFGYSDQAEPTRRLLADLADLLSPAGLSDAVYVDGRRWWSMTCTRGCCPPEGRPYGEQTHPLAAAAVFAGMQARPDRTDLEALAQGPRPAEVEALARVADAVATELSELTRPERARRMERLVTAGLEAGQVEDRDCLRLAVLAREQPVRDLAWAMITREHAADHLRVWSQVVARAPAPYDTAPVGLLGIAAWLDGDGALLNICADRMAVLDPDYPMSSMLRDISTQALDPDLWDTLRTDLKHR